MKYLGIDFGLKRIGLATSEGELASPWQILEVKNFADAVEKVSQIIKRNNFQKIIVGLPEGKMSKNVIGFINALKKRGFGIMPADETLSSRRAVEQKVLLNVSQFKRRVNDDTAAAIILQDYLDYFKQ